MLQKALDYAVLGLCTTFLQPKTKRPALTKWTERVTLNPDEIRKLWREYVQKYERDELWKDANIGIIVGKMSGVLGVDIDINHGADPSILQLFPRTWTTKTRLGFHLYFAYPDKFIDCHELLPPQNGKTATQAPAYLWTKTHQFVAAPSIVSLDNAGKEIEPHEYQWHSDAGGSLAPGEVPLAQLPEWCFQSTSTSVSLPGKKNKKLTNTRHAHFKKVAVAMWHKGATEDEIEAELHKVNLTECDPPKTEKDGVSQEIKNVVKWVARLDREDPLEKKKLSEIEMVDILFENTYKDVLVKLGKDLFQYVGTHWKHLGDPEIDRIHREIYELMGHSATSKKVDSAFKTFLRYVPDAPPDIFAPNPFMVNFLNGTLEIIRLDNGKYEQKFRDHHKKDFLINLIPLEYSLAEAYNPRFDQFIFDLFNGDEDGESKLRALKQMFGAALMPAFPKLFMCYGIPGTGKSQLMILIAKMLDNQNISRVDPCDMRSFALDSMAGKLVNIVTDVESNFAIQDNIIKQIEDRTPIRIPRKHIKDLMVPIPAVHLFGANGLPKTLDGHSGAHERRWILLELKNSRILGGNFVRDYAELVWRGGYARILQFALEGLTDLINCNGHYHNPASSQKRMKEWQAETDPIQLFLDDVASEEVSVRIEHEIYTIRVGTPADEIERTTFFKIFQQWLSDTNRRSSKITRNVFYKVLREKNIKEHRTSHGRFIQGYSSPAPKTIAQF